MSISLDKTSSYHPKETEELHLIGDDEDDLEDAPLIDGHGHKHGNKKKRHYSDKILCWESPPPAALVVWNEITLERVKIGIILIFVLGAACMFAFSKEEDEEILHLTGISLEYPMVRLFFLFFIIIV